MLLLVLPLCAQDGGESLPALAARLARAFADGDTSAITIAAQDPQLDPWLLADMLCSEGARGAAAALAEAAGDERLAGYVAARKEHTSLVARAHATLAQVTSQEQAIAGVQALLEGADAFERAALTSLIAEIRGDAESHAAAARAAMEAGWMARAEEALWNEGLAAHAVCDYERMIAGWERLLELRKLRKSPAGVASILRNLAQAHAEIGRYDRALRLLDAAESTLGAPDADSFTARGIIFRHLGRLRDSQKALERALEMTPEEQTGLRAEILHSLATVQMDLREYETATRRLQECLAIADERQSMLALGNLGVIHEEQGEWEAALAAFEKARDLSAAIGDLRTFAIALSNIGGVRFGQGRYEEALALNQEAHQRALAADDFAAAADIRHYLARTLGALGRREEAEREFTEAIAAAEGLGLEEVAFEAQKERAQMRLAAGDAAGAAEASREAMRRLAAMLQGLAEGQGARARASHAEAYETGLSAALALRDPAAFSYFAEESRAGSMRETLAGSASIREAAIPENLRNAEARAREAEREAKTVYRRAVEEKLRSEIRRRGDELTEIRAELVSISERVQREARAGAALAYPVADPLDKIRARLAPGDVWIAYSMLQKEAAALVATRTEAKVVALGPTSAMREAIERAEGVWGPLAALLLDPLGLGDEVERLLISPDGELYRVPFAALAPGRDIAYLPSGTIHGILLESGGKRGEGVLALGGVDYTDRTEWPALPASGNEAQSVGDRVLAGPNATAAALRLALLERTRWRSLHLACHGRFDEKQPLLSGLALTVAGGDDGFLDVSEVFSLRVPADIVVLSACDTAKGALYRGEGVVGLTRAFMYAGSPRVVASLWKVDDAATAALMSAFYEALRADESPARALRIAQAKVRAVERWKNASYWAAWQLWGLPD